MSKNNKKKYPRFFTNRLKKKWPFSLKLAKNLSKLNQDDVCSSFRDFFDYIETSFVYMAPEKDESDSEDESDYLGEEADLSYSDKNELIGGMDIWYSSEYPGFFIKNNKVHYEETIKSKVQNSTEDELTIKTYTLDHIPYQTIVCEGSRFYINNFLQGSVVNFNAVELKILSLSLIWAPVFKYLLLTKFSSAMKKTLENQNYIKNYEKQILVTFYDEFKRMKCNQISVVSLERILSKTERSVFEERLLNVFLFSGISENKSKKLLTNFFLTESLDEILSFYQELLSQFETGVN